MGLSNTFATLPGIIGVAATGFIVQATGSFAAAFYLRGHALAQKARLAVLTGFGRSIPHQFDFLGVELVGRPAADSGKPEA